MCIKDVHFFFHMHATVRRDEEINIPVLFNACMTYLLYCARIETRISVFVKRKIHSMTAEILGRCDEKIAIVVSNYRQIYRDVDIFSFIILV